jgi:hypothetical protein
MLKSNQGPILSSSPPNEVRSLIESISFESIIKDWFAQKSSYINATLEGYINGFRVDILPEEILHTDKLNKSFRLTNVQLYSPEVKKYCDTILAQEGVVLTANMYFTPHQDAQCFTWHSDSQFSQTYQIEGEKKWSFLKDHLGFVREKYEQEKILRKFKEHELQATEIEFTLSKGSWLEFPYCLLHKAQNLGDTPSVHITFAYNTATWGDFGKFAFEKIMGIPLRDNYMDKISIEELKSAIKNFNGDYTEFLKEFKEHVEIIENIKRTQGRPYGYEL